MFEATMTAAVMPPTMGTILCANSAALGYAVHSLASGAYTRDVWIPGLSRGPALTNASPTTVSAPPDFSASSFQYRGCEDVQESLLVLTAPSDRTCADFRAEDAFPPTESLDGLVLDVVPVEVEAGAEVAYQLGIREKFDWRVTEERLAAYLGVKRGMLSWGVVVRGSHDSQVEGMYRGHERIRSTDSFDMTIITRAIASALAATQLRNWMAVEPMSDPQTIGHEVYESLCSPLGSSCNRRVVITAPWMQPQVSILGSPIAVAYNGGGQVIWHYSGIPHQANVLTCHRLEYGAESCYLRVDITPEGLALYDLRVQAGVLMIAEAIATGINKARPTHGGWTKDTTAPQPAM